MKQIKSIIGRYHIILYFLIVVVICLFTLYIFFYDKADDTRQQQSAYTITKWENYERRTNRTKTVISGVLDVDRSIGSIFAFYSVHQNVEVYAGGRLIYVYPVVNNNPFSRSPGYCWNFVRLPNTTNNIEIVLTSPYEPYLDSIPEFYIGNEFSLPSHIIAANIFPFLTCVIMFVIGIVMIVYHLVVARNVRTNRKLITLGVFSVFLAIWSINECSITTMILKNNLVTSYLSFLSLMLLSYPFAMFVKTFYEDSDKIWDTFFTANILQIAACILLQLFGILDLRQTLWTTHMVMGFLALIVFGQSYLLLKNGIRSGLVKIHMVCILICAVSLVLDIAGYYTGAGDGNTFGRLGFLTYIAVLGLSSARESASLMKKGQEANLYQTLAYTDQMTGLNNRTRFNIDFERLSENPADVTVIDFDLNNLKHANDTFGHSAGDMYIKRCATIIYEIFNGIGTCYRVGGDEFVVLIEKTSEIDLTRYMAMLESSVDASNREGNKWNLKMQIAYGCACYSQETDRKLEDTYNRADKLMYRDKTEKKKRFTRDR